MTAWCWGFGWGDEVIDAKTRSMMNLAMIGALGKMQEWETHCRGALTNGVTQDEIRAIIHVIGIYCGVAPGARVLPHCAQGARHGVGATVVPRKPLLAGDGSGFVRSSAAEILAYQATLVE